MIQRLITAVTKNVHKKYEEKVFYLFFSQQMHMNSLVLEGMGMEVRNLMEKFVLNSFVFLIAQILTASPNIDD